MSFLVTAVDRNTCRKLIILKAKLLGPCYLASPNKYSGLGTINTLSETKYAGNHIGISTLF